MTADSNPSSGTGHMELADALYRAESWAQNAGVRPSPDMVRNVVSALKAEVERLQEVIRRVQVEGGTCRPVLVYAIIEDNIG